MKTSILWAFLMPVVAVSSSLVSGLIPRTFKIDFENNQFLKDGKPFQYISGSIHYYRSTEEQWDSLLKKCRLGGLNTISINIPWKLHQKSTEQDFDFSGNRNLFKFIDLAKQNDLLVIVRAGPYIDSDLKMGGLPPWLLWTAPGVKLRSSQQAYLFYVTRWFDELLPKLRPYLYENGGAVISMQIENGYGSYGCDKAYTGYLRDISRRYLGPNLVLFTTDGPKEELLKCGSVEGVYATTGFGPDSATVMNSFFAQMRKVSPHGPLVNSEFYSGWPDRWQTTHRNVSTEIFTRTLDILLGEGASINIYMYHGGTNYGFTQGATIDDAMYNPIITSYDFDAPLSEAGDPTEKYFGIKGVIQKYFSVASENPTAFPKTSYGRVYLKKLIALPSPSFLPLFAKLPELVSTFPMSYEELHQPTGFVIHHYMVPFITSDPILLSAKDLHGRAYIYVNHIFQGILSRQEKIFSTSIRIQQNDTLGVLMEDQGRVSFGKSLGESVGLGKNLTLGGHQLLNWTSIAVTGLNNRTLVLGDKRFPTPTLTDTLLDIKNGGAGIIYTGNFTLGYGKEVTDTFIRFDGFSKGVVWVNGINLGRYWPVGGPQVTFFLPGSLLKSHPQVNEFVVFELESSPDACYVPQQLVEPENQGKCFITLTDKEELDKSTPFPAPKLPFNAMFR